MPKSNPTSFPLNRIETFWSHVDRSNGPTSCWLWCAGANSAGYGKFHLEGIEFYAHRLAWMLLNGPIPDELLVLHRCDTPNCVNPAHLFLGTNADNAADKVAKGRQARGERSGMRLHPERHPSVLYTGYSPRGDQNGRRLHPDSYPKGEAVPGAKLTESDVRTIRNSVRQGVKQRVLAQQFNVSTNVICAIVHRRKWAHVPDDEFE